MQKVSPSAALAICAATFVSLFTACSSDDNTEVSEFDVFGATIDASSADEQSADPANVPQPPLLTCPPESWCSTLYPPGAPLMTAPDAEGRFVHDFSFAGYRYGQAPPATPHGATYVVTERGADATGQRDATGAVQQAIDAARAAGGGVVWFPPGTYRIDGQLAVTSSGIVLRGSGASSVLRFTKARGLAHSANITVSGTVVAERARPLAIDAAIGTREVLLDDASGLAAGDDVSVGWTITDAFTAEHGMTGTWTAFSGQYKPIFKRTVVAVDTSTSPNRVVLDVPLRYPAKMRDGAALEKESGYVREIGIEHLAVTNAVASDAAWAEDRVSLLALRDVADAWVADVHSVSVDGSPVHLRSGGVLIENAKRVSVLHTSMSSPQNRGSGGNGYLFEVSRTSEVLIADSTATGGRHNFIQNWGFGNSGTVFLRCTSTGSEMLSLIGGKLTPEPAVSEHHHSLAMATLVDGSHFDDGFAIENRGTYSTGAGHTGTGSMIWRASGKGTITSKQYGWGYVIGTSSDLKVDTSLAGSTGAGTAPEDFVEGLGKAETLFPASLYEHQRARRLTAQ